MRGSIVHVVSSTRLERGGPSLSVTQLIENLESLGQSCILVSPDHVCGSDEFAQVRSRTCKSIDELRTLVPSPSIVGLHIHGIWDLELHRATAYARKHKLPYAISPHGMLEPWALRQKAWKKRLALSLYQYSDLKRATLIHGTADSETEQVNKLGLSNPKVTIPNGVTIPEPDFERLRTTNGDERTALFLSRIHPKKGLIMLAEAWATLRPTGWRMRIAGPDVGGHLAEVQTKVSTLGLADSWRFIGPVYGVKKETEFANANLFLLPTYSENFGIAVAEALAYGVPVLTTCGAPWSGLIDHRCGWWVDPTQIGIQGGLRSAFATGSAALREMGVRGREWVIRDFSWPSIASKILKAYEEFFSR